MIVGRFHPSWPWLCYEFGRTCEEQWLQELSPCFITGQQQKQLFAVSSDKGRERMKGGAIEERDRKRFICFLFTAQSNTLENSNISIIWMQSCVMDNITFSSFLLKGRVEEELQELQFDHLSIFRPGCVFIRSKRLF